MGRMQNVLTSNLVVHKVTTRLYELKHIITVTSDTHVSETGSIVYILHS